MNVKYGQIIAIVALGALTVGSFSVMGLLQSTERIGASGIIVRPVEDPLIIPPVSSPVPPPPEPTIKINLYSDQACTTPLTSVEWGEITAGGDSNIVVYVKNSGDTSVLLSLTTENWNSLTSKNNMDLSWNYDGSLITSGQIRQVTLTLSVDPVCPDLNSFGFDIVVIGS